MRIEATAEEDIAFGLEPCAPPVIHVRVADSGSLQVEFADGIKGAVKFLPSHLTGVFEVLRSPTFFAQVGIERGAVTWPGELDLAPDAMYDTIKQYGVWVLQ